VGEIQDRPASRSNILATSHSHMEYTASASGVSITLFRLGFTPIPDLFGNQNNNYPAGSGSTDPRRPSPKVRRTAFRAPQHRRPTAGPIPPHLCLTRPGARAFGCETLESFHPIFHPTSGTKRRFRVVKSHQMPIKSLFSLSNRLPPEQQVRDSNPLRPVTLGPRIPLSRRGLFLLWAGLGWESGV